MLPLIQSSLQRLGLKGPSSPSSLVLNIVFITNKYLFIIFVLSNQFIAQLRCIFCVFSCLEKCYNDINYWRLNEQSLSCVPFVFSRIHFFTDVTLAKISGTPERPHVIPPLWLVTPMTVFLDLENLSKLYVCLHFHTFRSLVKTMDRLNLQYICLFPFQRQ